MTEKQYRKLKSILAAFIILNILDTILTYLFIEKEQNWFWKIDPGNMVGVKFFACVFIPLYLWEKRLSDMKFAYGMALGLTILYILILVSNLVEICR